LEKENAKELEFKKGELELRKIKFNHKIIMNKD
jgi:hypothetical protein